MESDMMRAYLVELPVDLDLTIVKGCCSRFNDPLYRSGVGGVHPPFLDRGSGCVLHFFVYIGHSH